jgi:hypothetical protein
VVLWIALPFIGVWYTDAGYHQKYTELLLPQAFGLTALADLPTTVATLVSIYFCVRALFAERPLLLDGVAAGVAAGAAIAIKPATSLFLAGPVLAFAYRRRFELAGAMLAGLAPAVVTLAVWKERGLGHLPVLSQSAGRLAGHGLAAGAPLGGLSFGKYYHQLNWSHLADNIDQLREHFWSGRLIVWLVVAGLVGLARRSLTASLLVGGWFLAFALVKGSYAEANVADGSFFRILMPSYPAFVLLIAAVPLLLPHLPAKLRPFRAAFAPPRPRTRWSLVGAALLLSSVAPLAAFAAADPHGKLEPATVGATFMPVPVNVDLGLSASIRGRRVTLTWRACLLQDLARPVGRSHVRSGTRRATLQPRAAGGRGHEGRPIRRQAGRGSVDIPRRDRGELARRPAVRRPLSRQRAVAGHGAVGATRPRAAPARAARAVARAARSGPKAARSRSSSGAGRRG